jgi:hypothetical protein
MKDRFADADTKLLVQARDDIPDGAQSHGSLSVVVDTRLPDNVAQISGFYLIVSPTFLVEHLCYLLSRRWNSNVVPEVTDS